MASWRDIDALNSYGAHSGEKKENGPSDLEKRDGVGWEEKEALEREAKSRAGDTEDKQGIRVMRFGGNTPLIAGMGASEVRQMCIARMPFLSMQNGSNVRVKERLEAEKSYVRRVMREIAREKNESKASGSTDEPPPPPAEGNSPNPSAAILKEHPRFMELYNTFGTQLTPMGAGGTGSLGTQDVVSVTLRSMAAGSIEKDPVTKKLPANFQIGKLKQLCKRLFDLDVELQTLYFEVGDKMSGMVPTFLDDDESTIGFFGVLNGATIFMNEIDLEQKQREAEAWAEEQRRREDEQQRRLASMQAMKVAQHGAELAAMKQAAQNP